MAIKGLNLEDKSFDVVLANGEETELIMLNHILLKKRFYGIMVPKIIIDKLLNGKQTLIKYHLVEFSDIDVDEEGDIIVDCEEILNVNKQLFKLIEERKNASIQILKEFIKNLNTVTA